MEIAKVGLMVLGGIVAVLALLYAALKIYNMFGAQG